MAVLPADDKIIREEPKTQMMVLLHLWIIKVRGGFHLLPAPGWLVNCDGTWPLLATGPEPRLWINGSWCSHQMTWLKQKDLKGGWLLGKLVLVAFGWILLALQSVCRGNRATAGTAWATSGLFCVPLSTWMVSPMPKSKEFPSREGNPYNRHGCMDSKPWVAQDPSAMSSLCLCIGGVGVCV